MVDLEELERLEKAATPGPWVVYKRNTYNGDALVYMDRFPDGYGCWQHWRPGDAEAMCAMRTAFPQLLAELRAAREQADYWRSRARCLETDKLAHIARMNFGPEVTGGPTEGE